MMDYLYEYAQLYRHSKRHAAMVIKAGSVLSIAVNTPSKHAEEMALVGLTLGQTAVATVVCFRIKKDNSVGLAAPCERCAALMREYHVKDVWYTTNTMTIHKAQLKTYEPKLKWYAQETNNE